MINAIDVVRGSKKIQVTSFNNQEISQKQMKIEIKTLRKAIKITEAWNLIIVNKIKVKTTTS